MSLTREQALDCLASDDLIGLGMEADAVRRRLHPEGVVTYTLARFVPWPASANDAAAVEEAARLALDAGATSLHFTGNAPRQSLGWFQALFSGLCEDFPGLALCAFSPADVAALAAAGKRSVPDTLQALRSAGLATLSANADASFDAALATHRAAHEVGLRTTAALTFGAGDSATTLLDSIFAIRDLQQQTTGFSSCLLLPFQPEAAGQPDEPTAVETLKTLAVARLVLDNIPHLEAHAPTQGLKVLQMALRFGADDAGVLPLPGPVAMHRAHALTEEEMRRTIRDAGFRPVERDALFLTHFLI